MKDKQVACVLLLLAVVACIFGILQMQGQLTAARKGANGAKDSAETAKSQRVRSVKNLEDLRVKSQNKLAYFDTWKSYFDSYKNQSDVQDIIDSKLKDEGLIPISNRPEQTKSSKDDLITDIFRVHMSFVDSYPTLFNWLAAIERELPNSRVTHLNVKKASSEAGEIQMDISIEVPLVASSESKIN